VAAERDLVLREGQFAAASDVQLPFDQIGAGDHFGDRVFDLQARVHFEEPETVDAKRAAAIDDEFHRSGAFVFDRLCEFHGGVCHRGAHIIRHAGRGGLFQHFLAAALERAVALEQVDDVAVGIAEDLDFDMARLFDQFFQHDAAVAKGGFGLAHGAFKFILQGGSLCDKTDAPAPATCDGLDEQRIADILCR